MPAPFRRRAALNAQAMLGTEGTESRRAYLLLHAEPEFDCANPVAARAALEKADLVVVLSRRSARRRDYADVLLPIAPFTETRERSSTARAACSAFNGVVQPPGEARPGWKVLRVLGSMLGLPGFEFDTSEADSRRRRSVRRARSQGRLSNATGVAIGAAGRRHAGGVERVADVPIYFADPLVRRVRRRCRRRADARPPEARHASRRCSISSG